jgi:hypothetical protein
MRKLRSWFENLYERVVDLGTFIIYPFALPVLSFVEGSPVEGSDRAEMGPWACLVHPVDLRLLTHSSFWL